MNSIGSPGQALEAFTPVASSSVITLTSTGVTDLVNVTETGYIASIGVVYNASGSYAIEITIDGQTLVSIPLFVAGAAQSITAGYESVSAARILLPFGTMRYASSLRVSVNVTATGSGNCVIAMIRGKKI